jgi:hypothetical protein
MRLPHLPLALALAVSATDASAAVHQLVYYGGRMVSNPQVVAVSWGNYVDSAVVNSMGGFYTAILNSPYLDWVSEYSTAGLYANDGLPGSSQRIGRGSFAGSFVIAPSNSSTTLSLTDVDTEVLAQIAAGHLPAPVSDAYGNANTIYMVNFPSGVTLEDAQGDRSCVQFCGIQDTLVLNGKSVGIGMFVDIGPTSLCSGGCGGDVNYLNNVTALHAHQLLNIVTDLEVGLVTSLGRPLGWYDATSRGQIADLCNQVQAQVAGYTVETGWSNSQGACIAQVASLPLCDGSSNACQQCNSNGQCTGAGQTCETDATSPAFGECVTCPTDGGPCSAKPLTDAGTGGGPGGGSGGSNLLSCSTTGGFPVASPALLVLAALALGRARRLAGVPRRPR